MHHPCHPVLQRSPNLLPLALLLLRFALLLLQCSLLVPQRVLRQALLLLQGVRLTLLFPQMGWELLPGLLRNDHGSLESLL